MIGLHYEIKKSGFIWVVNKGREVRKHKIKWQLIFYDIISSVARHWRGLNPCSMFKATLFFSSQQIKISKRAFFGLKCHKKISLYWLTKRTLSLRLILSLILGYISWEDIKKEIYIVVFQILDVLFIFISRLNKEREELKVNERNLRNEITKLRYSLFIFLRLSPSLLYRL